MKLIKNSATLAKLRKQAGELGGIEAFRSGKWLPRLVAQTFRAYYANATPEFFRDKCPNHTDDQIFQKLRKSAIRQAGLVGAICGAAMSANELTALATGGELFVGLAGNLALAGLTIAADLVGVTVVQLRLVMQIAKLYGVEIDLDDPEDVWVILALAVAERLISVVWFGFIGTFGDTPLVSDVGAELD